MAVGETANLPRCHQNLCTTAGSIGAEVRGNTITRGEARGQRPTANKTKQKTKRKERETGKASTGKKWKEEDQRREEGREKKGGEEDRSSQRKSRSRRAGTAAPRTNLWHTRSGARRAW